MQNRILIVDDEINAAKYLARILASKGYSVDFVPSAEEAIDLFPEIDFDLLLIDMVLPGMNGLEFLKRAKAINPDLLAIVVTAYGSINTAVNALKAGAGDFIEKPVIPEKLCLILSRLFEERRLKREVVALKADLIERYRFGNLIGRHPKMTKIFSLIELLKEMDSAVLITGETGTGKDLVARAIHFESHRKNGPFVAINCASVPETLLESELFGYERGAFTGAARRKQGKLEQAHTGTLFLDEIADMPYPLQSKLLRTIQEKSIERLGSNKIIELDFRIIAATNKDLALEIAANRFRLDMYYRLNVVPIHLPALRERREDIPLLVDHFLEKFVLNTNLAKPLVAPEAMTSLMKHSWPGNVRELENVLERACILSQNHTIGEIPLSILEDTLSIASVETAPIDVTKPLKEIKEQLLAKAEKEYLSALLRKNMGSINKTASDAQIDVRTVLRKVKQYGLSKDDFK